MRLEAASDMDYLHGAVYGQSRVGKTTVAKHFHEAGHHLTVVTTEPGPARRALRDTNANILVPEDDRELLTMLEYPAAFFEQLSMEFPGMILFDNLYGLQELLVGQGARPAMEVEGIKVPARKASGIMRAGEASRSNADTGLPVMEFSHYGLLEMQTRRVLHLVEQLPCHTLITFHETLDSDQEHKVKTAGMRLQDAARVSRKVQGYPLLIGSKIRNAIPGLVGDFYLHLTQEGGRYFMWSADNGEWKASSGGLNLPAKIDWTNKNAYAILQEGRRLK